MALSQILPNMREDMELSIAQAGLLLSVINIGTLVAYLLILATRCSPGWYEREVRLQLAPRLDILHRLAAGFDLQAASTGWS